MDEWLQTSSIGRRKLIDNRTKRSSIATKKQVFESIGAATEGVNYVNDGGYAVDGPVPGAKGFNGDFADFVISQVFPKMYPSEASKNSDLTVKLPDGTSSKGANLLELGLAVKDNLEYSMGPFSDGNKKVVEQIAAEAAKLVFTEEDFIEAKRIQTVMSGDPEVGQFVLNEDEQALTDVNGEIISVPEDTTGVKINEGGTVDAPILESNGGEAIV